MWKYCLARILKKMRGSAIRNSVIHKTSKVNSGSQIVNSIFDKHSYCGYDCQIINCSVGAFTSIASNVVIGGAMHPMHWVSTSPAFYAGRNNGAKKKFAEHIRPSDLTTTVGNDVWIGQGAILKAGIIVGDGAVIGMGSIVTKDVPPYFIVAGNPARFISKRFDEAQIETLLSIKWWSWSDKEIQKFAPFFNDLNRFLAEVSE